MKLHCIVTVICTNGFTVRRMLNFFRTVIRRIQNEVDTWGNVYLVVSAVCPKGHRPKARNNTNVNFDIRLSVGSGHKDGIQ